MVVVSAGHVGGTRGSGIVSSAADVLGMSEVRGMREVDGVCEMCICLARVGRWGKRIGFGLYQSCGNMEIVERAPVFGLRWCRWGVCRWLGPGSGGMVLCLCEL